MRKEISKLLSSKCEYNVCTTRSINKEWGAAKFLDAWYPRYRQRCYARMIRDDFQPVTELFWVEHSVMQLERRKIERIPSRPFVMRLLGAGQSAINKKKSAEYVNN